jgi:glycosyltransferase involved in cell wall biosynthesis
MSVIEAMCCGCVPIISNVGDIEDACINNFNSILIKNPNDVEAFKSAVIKLLKNNKLLNKLSRNAVKIKNKFSFKEAEKIWLDIFNKLGLIK